METYEAHISTKDGEIVMAYLVNKSTGKVTYLTKDQDAVQLLKDLLCHCT
jgi:hypothetical protein